MRATKCSSRPQSNHRSRNTPKKLLTFLSDTWLNPTWLAVEKSEHRGSCSLLCLGIVDTEQRFEQSSVLRLKFLVNCSNLAALIPAFSFLASGEIATDNDEL